MRGWPRQKARWPPSVGFCGRYALGYVALRWRTRREFEASCSPSATINRLAVPWAEKIAKILRICPKIRPGEFRGPVQLLSMAAGECVFLQALRTTNASPTCDFVEIGTGSRPPILNPSPSTEVTSSLVPSGFVLQSAYCQGNKVIEGGPRGLPEKYILEVIEHAHTLGYAGRHIPLFPAIPFARNRIAPKPSPRSFPIGNR